MKKTLLLLFALLTMGGVSSVKAEKLYLRFQTPWYCTATWTESTSTFTWGSGGTGNPDWTFMAVEDLSGDLSSWTKLHMKLSDWTNVTVTAQKLTLYFKENKGNTQSMEWVVPVELTPDASGNVDIDLTDLDWKTVGGEPIDNTKIVDVTIYGGARTNENQDGSVKVTEAYLYKPTQAVALTFDALGAATTNIATLVAEGGLSYNEDTHVLTTDGTAGTLTLDLVDPVDLQYLKTLTIAHTGDNDIIDRLYYYEDDACTVENQSWGFNKWGGTTDANATNKFTGKTIKKLQWKSEAGKATTLTATIQSITWQLKLMSATKGTDITTLPFKNWSADGDNDATITSDINSWECANNFNKLTSDPIYGGQNLGDSKRYVDLTSYKKLIVRGYGTIRLFYNWQQANTEVEPAIAESKPIEYINIDASTVQSYELDLDAFKVSKGITHFHLVGVKGNGQCFVESISVLDGTETADYVISGDGLQTAAVTAALNAPTATLIDATGVTGTGVDLTPGTEGNPNCIFLASAGVLANTKNVSVDGTIANLDLTDGYPMKVPTGGATATAATYSRNMASGIQFGTICLPYPVSSTDEVKFYTIAALSDETITLQKEATLAAGTPAIVWRSASDAATITVEGSGALADVVAASSDLQLRGTFEEQTINASDYTGGIYGIYNNEFVEAETSITLPPFRAFFTTVTGAAGTGGAAKYRLVIADEEETAIKNLTGKGAAKVVGIYSVNGARQQSLQKGMNVVKFSDGKSQKVLVK